MKTNYKIEKTHIDNIVSGNTILHEGKLRTVCAKDISYGGFMGTSVFGDSYHSGHKPLQKVWWFTEARL
jgi:hypothetical protein